MQHVISFPKVIRNMPENSDFAVAKPPSELKDDNASSVRKINDKVIYAIELLKEHGFIVLVI